MANATTNRMRLSYWVETTWGETADGGSNKHNATEVRYTGESLSHQKETVTSNEVRSDRMKADVIEVAAGATGGFNMELSSNTFEDFIQGALEASAITSVLVTGVTCAFTSAGISAQTGAPFANLEVDQYVKLAGSGANSGIFRIKTKTSSSAIAVSPSSLTPTTQVSTTITGRRFRNGATLKSFGFEKNFLDLSSAVVAFTGMRVNNMSLNVAAGEILTGSFDFMGKRGQAFTAGSSVVSTFTSATTTNVYNATSNVGNIREKGVSLATAVRAITLNTTNNLRQQRAVANQYPVGVGDGSFGVTGTIDAYFDKADLYERFITHASTMLSFTATDASNGFVGITLPKVYFSGGDPQSTGLDADVMQSMEFIAARDPTTGAMMLVDLLP